MPGVSDKRLREMDGEWRLVRQVLQTSRAPDKDLCVGPDEFARRRENVASAVSEAGADVGFVFSDEHYDGDVPYLGGNTNVTIEQVAGAVGPGGFHIAAGLEGGYVAEQLAPRAGAAVHKVELLKLADEEYPIQAEKLEDVLEEANAGRPVKRIALLTPPQVVPAALVDYLRAAYGPDNIIDGQELYQRIRYEKSDREMELIADACAVGDAMMRAMLAVLRPGMYETQVAGWGYLVARELGAEEMGWNIMVGCRDANRTLIGKALNRRIEEGDWVHLGVAPKRDGLNSCVRRSVIATQSPQKVTPEQRFWFDLVEGGYAVGLAKYVEVARSGAPAKLQEQALVDYFAAKSAEVSKRTGKDVRLETLKPYTGTHNAGYTECQEFFGAITLASDEPLGRQIVTMLDVALRGVGDRWDDVVLPGFDFCVVENTLGKFGERVEVLSKLPVNVQSLVGRG